jgi:hypothetical protein
VTLWLCEVKTIFEGNLAFLYKIYTVSKKCVLRVSITTVFCCCVPGGIMFLPYAVEDNIERKKTGVNCCLKWKFKYYKQRKREQSEQCRNYCFSSKDITKTQKFNLCIRLILKCIWFAIWQLNSDMMSCNKILRFFFLLVFCHYNSVIYIFIIFNPASRVWQLGE